MANNLKYSKDDAEKAHQQIELLAIQAMSTLKLMQKAGATLLDAKQIKDLNALASKTLNRSGSFKEGDAKRLAALLDKMEKGMQAAASQNTELSVNTAALLQDYRQHLANEKVSLNTKSQLFKEMQLLIKSRGLAGMEVDELRKMTPADLNKLNLPKIVIMLEGLINKNQGDKWTETVTEFNKNQDMMIGLFGEYRQVLDKQTQQGESFRKAWENNAGHFNTGNFKQGIAETVFSGLGLGAFNDKFNLSGKIDGILTTAGTKATTYLKTVFQESDKSVKSITQRLFTDGKSYVTDTIKTFTSSVSKSTDKLKGVFTTGVKSFTKLTDGLGAKIKQLSQVKVTGDNGLLSNLGGGLGKLLGVGGKLFKFAPVIGALAAGGMELANGGSARSATGAAVGAGAGTFAGGAIGAAIGSFILPGVGTAIGGWIGKLLGGFLGGILGKAVANLDFGQLWSDTKGLFTSWVLEPAKKGLNFIKDIFEAIGKGFSSLWDWLEGLPIVGKLFKGARVVGSAVGSAVSAGASAAGTAVSSAASAVGGMASSAAKSTVGFVKNVASKVGTGIKSLFGVKAGGGTHLDKVNPMVMGKLAPMAKEYKERTGKDLNITDGWRSSQMQAQLYQQKPGLAAPPGKSMHEFGFALDMNSKQATELDNMGLLGKYGFTRPMWPPGKSKKAEEWHVEPIEIQGKYKEIRAGYVPSQSAEVASAGAGADMTPKAATEVGAPDAGGNAPSPTEGPSTQSSSVASASSAEELSSADVPDFSSTADSELPGIENTPTPTPTGVSQLSAAKVASAAQPKVTAVAIPSGGGQQQQGGPSMQRKTTIDDYGIAFANSLLFAV